MELPARFRLYSATEAAVKRIGQELSASDRNDKNEWRSWFGFVEDDQPVIEGFSPPSFCTNQADRFCLESVYFVTDGSGFIQVAAYQGEERIGRYDIVAAGEAQPFIADPGLDLEPDGFSFSDIEIPVHAQPHLIKGLLDDRAEAIMRALEEVTVGSITSFDYL